MSRRKEIFKDTAIFTASSYLAQVFDMVNGILLRRFLGPANMGIWSFLQVIQNYAKHAGLGVAVATARDVPYYLGKGDQAKAQEIQNLVFTFTTAASCVAAACVMLYASCNYFKYSKPIVYGLYVVAAIIILQRLYNLLVVLVRAHKQFVFAGFLNIVSSLSTLLLTVLLVWKFKLYGFYAALILQYFLMIALIFRKTSYRFSFYFDSKAFAPLLSLGSAMVVSDIMRTVFSSIDRIMIAKFLGFTELGYYSIALMANNYLYALPNMIGIIFFPHFQEVFAKNDNREDLEKYLHEPTLCVAFLFPFLIGLVWVVSSWIVPILLPQYIAGIPALKYMILGSFFMALTHPFSNFIITVRKHWLLIPIQAVLILFGFAACGYALWMGWRISGIALATTWMSLAFFIALSAVSLKTLKRKGKTLKLYLKIFIIFAAMLAALGLSEFANRLAAPAFLRAVVQYALFFILMSPLLVWAEKEVRILSTVKNAATDFLKNRKEPVIDDSGTEENI